MHTWKLVAAIVILGVIGFAAASIVPQKPVLNPPIVEEEGPYLCNGDGFRCEDGTIVGRTGPRCEFTACPGVHPAANGILKGRVTLSPTCPVERFPADPNCAPKAYVTRVSAILEINPDVVVETMTNENGEYELSLAPGAHFVHADSGRVFPTCGKERIEIKSGQTLVLDLDCDSGIR